MDTKIMEMWKNEDDGKTLTLYIERKKSLNLGLGAEDYWAFVARYDKGDSADAADVLGSLISHGYKAVADSKCFVGTISVFLS